MPILNFLFAINNKIVVSLVRLEKLSFIFFFENVNRFNDNVMYKRFTEITNLYI